MKLVKTNDNKYVVRLTNNKQSVNKLAHRLVLETFIGPCPEGMEACHNNGDGFNNTLDNLRWDTQKANGEDMVKHGTSTFGEKNPMSILTEFQVRVIKKLLLYGTIQQKDIAIIFNISRANICVIGKNKRWNYLNK